MTINSLFDEKITFLLSYYGNGICMGFKGERDAIERCYNWAHNTGVTYGALHWFYDKWGRLAYVLISDREQLLKGLIAQFRAEIIMMREVALLKDEYKEDIGAAIEYDEVKIEKLAKIRAEKFMQEKVVLENFMTNQPTSVAQTHEVHLPRANFNKSE